MIIIIPIIIIVLVLLQGFFSNSEMAMVSSNKIKLEYKAKQGDKKAQIVQNLLNNPERLFGTTLVGVNIATVLSSALAHYYFFHVIYNLMGGVTRFVSVEVVSILIMEPLILIMGELFPMSMARKYPNTTSLKNAYRIKIGYIVFFPLMLTVSSIAKLVGLLFKNKDKEFGKISRDELELLVGGRFKDTSKKTYEIIKDVFDVNSLTASDVMIPLDKVIAVNKNSKIKHLKKIMQESNFSRIPIYSDNIFNVIGTINAPNILGVPDDEIVEPYARKLYIVPKSKPIMQVLSEFKTNRKYIGIVVDELGTVSGIITIIDIVEEIVGNVDESIEISKTNTSNQQNSVFDADIRLDDFYKIVNYTFEETNAKTLAGIIIQYAERIPHKGEIITCGDKKIEILDATDRAIKKVRIIE